MSTTKDEYPTVELENRSKTESGLSDALGSPSLTPEEEARIWRKIDLRLMPILALIYLFSFLDRGISHVVNFRLPAYPALQETSVWAYP